MAGFNDLTITLAPQDSAGENDYEVSFTYKMGDQPAYYPPGGTVTIDPDALLAGDPYQIPDPQQYGNQLTESFFSGEIKTSFVEARTRAQEAKVALRLRLQLEEAPDLQRVRWELLQDPSSGALLCGDQSLIFSRFPQTRALHKVAIRPKSQLRALVMVANPSDLDPEKLAPIDKEKEFATARDNLGAIITETLAEPGSSQPATLRNLLYQLQERKYDILYLVCHGAFARDKTLLYFEDDEGKMDLVDGRDLQDEVRRLRDEERPNLLILGSCESAGDGEGPALTALGPQLAQAGVPAVMAMQGKIEISTNQSFMAHFFQQLYAHGIIDQAMADARWHLREEDDFWMPVLFMRLEDGRIWSGFSEGDTFELWPVLQQAIAQQKLVPIIGTGLMEPVIGSMSDISKMWARRFEYPMYEHDIDAIPQISQFLSTEFGIEYTKTELRDSLHKKLIDENREVYDQQDPQISLDEFIDVLAARRRAEVKEDAYGILAQLPVSVYITANLSRVMESALAEKDRSAHSLISPWNQHVRRCYYGYPAVEAYDEGVDCVAPQKYDFSMADITIQTPLVFHPFGRLDDPGSVVLTEDEYFTYLTGLKDQENQNLLLDRYPTSKIHTGTLLFLGFHLVDWEFRVLLQTLMTFRGSDRLFNKHKRHIAVIQLDQPEFKEKWEEARDYLQKRLQRDWEIYMYVGSAEDFLSELQFFLPASLGGRQP